MNNILYLAREIPLAKAMKGLALTTMLLMVTTAPTYAAEARNHERQGNSSWGLQNRGQQRRVDKDWRKHEQQAYRHWNRNDYEPRHRYIYAPPVVYAPPVYESPGINFIIPLNIR